MRAPVWACWRRLAPSWGSSDAVAPSDDWEFGAADPFRVELELLYQSIAFRSAHNLDAYKSAPEPAQVVGYYQSMSAASAASLAADATTVAAVR